MGRPAIATELGISLLTVSRTLHRLGLSRIKDINPFPPPRRYERSKPGEMIHIDIKKLGHFKAPGIESPDGTPACTETGPQDGNTCTSASTTIPAWLPPL